MAYMREDMVSRAGYSGLGSLATNLIGGVGNVLTSWASSSSGGTTALTPQQQADIAAAQAAQSDHTMLYLGLGVAGIAAYFMLRKKKGG